MCINLDEEWKLDYFCFNNNNYNGYSNGCFKRVVLTINDIIYKERWNNETMEYEDSFYFVCKNCGSITIIDDRVIPEEIKLYLKKGNALKKK